MGDRKYLNTMGSPLFLKNEKLNCGVWVLPFLKYYQLLITVGWNKSKITKLLAVLAPPSDK